MILLTFATLSETIKILILSVTYFFFFNKNFRIAQEPPVRKSLRLEIKKLIIETSNENKPDDPVIKLITRLQLYFIII